jgi:hypothetical protein
MARSFTEQRLTRVGNTFLDAGAIQISDYALLPPSAVLSKTKALKMYAPGLLKRHHSIAEFVPSALADVSTKDVFQELAKLHHMRDAEAKSQVDAKQALPVGTEMPRLLGSAGGNSVGSPCVAAHQMGTDMGVPMDTCKESKRAEAEQCQATRRKAGCRAVFRLQEAVPSSSPTLESNGVTTLMIRNLPQDSTQNAVLRALDQTGFWGRYDFCYCPTDFKTRVIKGFAFVNFITAADADEFQKAWLHDCPLKRSDQGSLSIRPAVVQGLHANLQMLENPRMKRVRCPGLRPFVSMAQRE